MQFVELEIERKKRDEWIRLSWFSRPADIVYGFLSACAIFFRVQRIVINWPLSAKYFVDRSSRRRIFTRVSHSRPANTFRISRDNLTPPKCRNWLTRGDSTLIAAEIAEKMRDGLATMLAVRKPRLQLVAPTKFD